MKTKLLLITLLALGGITVSNAQKDTAAASRPFYDYLYAEGHFGLLLADKIYFMGNAGAGLKITPQHYLGVEFAGFAFSDVGVSASASGGWGLQYQYRFRKWYFLASGGELDKVGFTSDAPFEYSYTEAPNQLAYFRIGAKHCFWGLLCVGCQYAQSTSFESYASDLPPPAPPRYREWIGPVQAITLTFGLLLQNPPKLERK